MLQAFKEGLAVFEALRRLGFESREIYAVANEPFQLELMAQGKTFVVDVGETGLDKDELVKGWDAACRWWKAPTTTEGERQAIWESSEVMKYSYNFVSSLVLKGFKLPCATMPRPEDRPC